MWNPFKRKDASPAEVKDTWDLAQVENDEGKPMFLRVNTGLKAIAGRRPFTHRVGVTFLLRQPDEHGLPGPEESEALNQFEDALLPALAVPALVITTKGFREFVFYTATPDAVPATVDTLRSQFPANEVQSYAEADAAWTVYRSFVG